jgi:protoheme IX farnesyltransferase
LIGSISGAVPPLVGYLAVTNYLSVESVLLFLLFCLWQMPHSYAIAIFRMEDYRQAGIPVLPVKEGLNKANQHIRHYVLAFCAVAAALFFVGEANYEYLIVVGAMSAFWARVTFRDMNSSNYIDWSKAVFKVSLLVVTSFSGVLGLELLPLHF